MECGCGIQWLNALHHDTGLLSLDLREAMSKDPEGLLQSGTGSGAGGGPIANTPHSCLPSPGLYPLGALHD